MPPLLSKPYPRSEASRHMAMRNGQKLEGEYANCWNHPNGHNSDHQQEHNLVRTQVSLTAVKFFIFDPTPSGSTSSLEPIPSKLVWISIAEHFRTLEPSSDSIKSAQKPHVVLANSELQCAGAGEENIFGGNLQRASMYVSEVLHGGDE